MSESESKYDMSRPVTGARLVEMGLLVLVSSVLSAGMASIISSHVLAEQVMNLKASQEEIKRELRDLRRDIYRPAWPEQQMQLDFVDFRDDLINSLHTAGKKFTGTDADPDDDWRRFALAAAADLATRRGRTLVGEISLVAGTTDYVAPADVIFIKTPIWGTEQRFEPWDDDYPGRLPRPRITRVGSEVTLHLFPAPTQKQILALGAVYRFYYAAAYWTGAVDDPIILDRPDDRELLLLRAQAEVARELSIMNIAAPGETKIKLAQSRDMTSRSLFDALMAEFCRRTGTGVPA